MKTDKVKTFDRWYLRFALMLGIFASVNAAEAGIMRGDVPSSEYEAYALSDPAFAAVGWLAATGSDGWQIAGSAVLIDPYWLLTAGHVADGGYSNMAFSLSRSVYTDPPNYVWAEEWFIHPEYSLAAGWGKSPDLALVRLSQPIMSVDPAMLYGSSVQVGDSISMCGYGAPGTHGAGELAFDGVKRAGTNVIEGFGGLWPYDEYAPYFTFSEFDRPSHSDVTPLEMLGSGGDSGSGLFLTVGEQTYLAGINAIIDGSYGPGLMYGNSTGSVDISQFNDWINDTMDNHAVPEPSSLVLFGTLSLAGIPYLLRRRRTSPGV